MAKETRISTTLDTDPQLRTDLEVIASAEDFSAIRTEWRAFLDRPTVTAGFFTDPLVLEQDACFEGDSFLIVGRVYQRDDLVAIVPLTCKTARVSIHFGIISLFRPVARVAKVPDFEFSREERVNPFEVFSSIVRAFRERPRLGDMIIVDCAPEAPKDLPRSAFTVGGVQTTYIIQVEGDFDTYEHNLSSKSRKKIRRYLRNLEEHTASSVRAVCYKTPDEMNALHEKLRKVWEKSWHARVGRQQVPSESYLKVLADSGWIRAYVLFATGQPVASILGFQYRGSYYYEAPAYDQDWREWSPGIVLLYLSLKDTFERDRPSKFDFGFGYGQYKEVFGTEEARRGGIRLGTTKKGKAIVGLQVVLDRLFRWCKIIMEGTGIPRWIKKKIREGK